MEFYSDPENALRALVEQVLEELGGMTSRSTPTAWKQAQGGVGNLQATLYGQIRTLVIHVQDTYGLKIPVNSVVFPWAVKHAQWLLNRYLIHSDGLTSWQRRWNRTYDRAICSFLEAVTFKVTGLAHKASPTWRTGLWVGKCTESDEHILLTELGAFKARSIRRKAPQDQVDVDLAKKVTGLPWSPKDNSKDADKDTFVFPAGQLARPTAPEDSKAPLDKDGHTEGQATEDSKDPEVDGQAGTLDEQLDSQEPQTPPTSPRTRPHEGELDFMRLPVRRRLTRFGGSPKREATAAELVPVEEAKSKILRVSSVTEHGTFATSFVCEISLKNGDAIEIHVNEDPEEKKLELMSQEPLLWYETEFDEELLKAGMKRELQSLKDFDVFEEIHTSNLSDQQIKSAIPTGWVHKAKGLEVKSRVVVRGYAEQVSDPDDTYASTPSFTTLKLLLTLAISRSWFVMGADVSTAFLHALWTKEETFIIPPWEFYPNGGVLWKLRKALYGLKSSPKLWQTHFASTMSKFDFVRCKSDANLYRHVDGDLYVLCYVDDLLIAGEQSRVEATFALLSSELLMKNTGTV